MATKNIKTKEVIGKTGERWVNVAWVVLLVGGLAHMLPGQMAPVVRLALWGISLQTVVGVLSVILALYFLLGED